MAFDEGLGMKGEQKPLLERYKVYVRSNLGIGKYSKYGILGEIYSPDNLTDDLDEISLSQRLEEHRKSGNSLVAKLAHEDGVVSISPSNAYTISVTEWKRG